MHAIGAVGVGMALLPSLLCSRLQLACNASIPNLQASAWPLVNSSALMFAISYLCCSWMLHGAGLHELAVCTAMHSVARIILAFVHTALSCPLPPIFMPAAAASGMGLALGALVVYAGHATTTTAGNFFYMNHAWATLVAVLFMRHTVLRAAAGAVCMVQGAIIVEDAVTMRGGW
jgi:hypothetical protein